MNREPRTMQVADAATASRACLLYTSTEYAMEQMFFVIDSRYRSRRPMIITTNLKLSELKNPPDLAHARIYDRIPDSYTHLDVYKRQETRSRTGLYML